MFDVEGLLSPVLSDRVGDVGVSLAGLASAGEDRALLQSVLDMEAALFSMSVSHEGTVGTEAGGNGAAARGKRGLMESTQGRFKSMSSNEHKSSAESVVGIAAVSASFNTKLEKLQVSRMPLSWCRLEPRAVATHQNIYILRKKKSQLLHAPADPKKRRSESRTKTQIVKWRPRATPQIDPGVHATS